MRKNVFNRKPATEVAETVTETAAVMQVVKVEDAATEQAADEAPAVDAAHQDEQPATGVEAPAPLTLDAVFERVNRIKAVSERLTQHRNTGNELAGFQLGTSGFQDTLTLRDGTGKEWKTNRTPAIQLVLDMLRGELRTVTTATEAELRELLAA